MIVDGYDVFVIDGSIADWLQDEAVQSIPFDELPADAAEKLCRLALERGFSCAIERKKRWVKGGDADGSEESGEKL